VSGLCDSIWLQPGFSTGFWISILISTEATIDVLGFLLNWIDYIGSDLQEQGQETSNDNNSINNRPTDNSENNNIHLESTPSYVALPAPEQCVFLLQGS